MEDLAYHARVLDVLGAGPESGMVLHIGGAYGDKAAAAARFVGHFGELPPAIAGRLWLENDDTTWDTSEVLEIALAVGRPMVLDVQTICPCSWALPTVPRPVKGSEREHFPALRRLRRFSALS